MSFLIDEWSPSHLRWKELVQAIADENQFSWAFDSFFEQFSRYFFVALNKEKIVGFLMFVVWDIGPNDREHKPVKFNGRTLTEAKIIAFGVKNTHRRLGIGRSLQERAIKRAKKLGCYQVRSVSGDESHENQQLKLSMSFAVEPMEREKPYLAFILPLH